MEVVSPVTAYKYLHINSENKVEQEPYTSHANIHVKIPEQIRNLKRVAVKSMSIGNTFFNIRDNANGTRSKLEWLEGVINDNNEIRIKEFSIEIPEGYYTVENLLNNTDARNEEFNGNGDLSINDAIANFDNFNTPIASERRVLDHPNAERAKGGTIELESNLVFSIDSVTDKVILTLDSNVEKFFMPIARQGEHNLWKEWGFGSHTIKKYTGNITDENNVAQRAMGQQMAAVQGVGGANFSTLLQQHTGNFLANVVSPIYLPPGNTQITYVGLRIPTFENIKGISICSDELSSGNSYETELFNEQNFAKRTNILDWVSNPVPHNSYIQYEPANMHWHICNKAILNDFDIQIKDVDGRVLSKNSLPHYYLVLVLEVEDHAYSQDYIKEFNRQAYREGHPTSMFG